MAFSIHCNQLFLEYCFQVGIISLLTSVRRLCSQLDELNVLDRLIDLPIGCFVQILWLEIVHRLGVNSFLTHLLLQDVKILGHSLLVSRSVVQLLVVPLVPEALLITVQILIQNFLSVLIPAHLIGHRVIQHG